MEHIIKALRVAIRAKGMLKTSRETGLNRAGFFHSFYKDGNNPGIMTVSKVADSLGYRTALVPARHSGKIATPLLSSPNIIK
ncbi:MAG: hypothetical protein LBQ02_02635 [Candidatus Nomurabacteria bacterium]|nr:hypothetical protein [Candidatus Nomurabacteria bacterium]